LRQDQQKVCKTPSQPIKNWLCVVVCTCHPSYAGSNKYED
jgi:hypothetical protein